MQKLTKLTIDYLSVLGILLHIYSTVMLLHPLNLTRQCFSIFYIILISVSCNYHMLFRAIVGKYDFLSILHVDLYQYSLTPETFSITVVLKMPNFSQMHLIRIT